MEKTNINRLLHVFIPFIAMVMVQNLLLLLFGEAGVSGVIPSLVAFIIAAAAAIFIFHIKTYEVPEEAPAKPRNVGVVGCVMYFFCTAAILILAMYAVSLVISNYSSAPAKVTPVYIVSVLVIHPLVEEYIFRNLFYKELCKLSPMFGVITQAVMFAIIHGTIDGMSYALISGIFLGIAMEKTDKMWVPCAVHIFINARSLVYLTWLAENNTIRHQTDVAFVSVGILALLILLIMRGRAALAVDGQQKETPRETKEND
ncbi:MAG: CPBP family intramembrane metalloprotease [Ruminococcaceae bacterium]|nr:CPBP family intramembrane metalloprotease [Oscillospiraceae bacterium]